MGKKSKAKMPGKQTIRWIVSVLLLISSFGGEKFGPANVLLFLAGVWFMPLPFFDQLKEKFVPKKGIRTLIATLLCVLAVLTMPMSEDSSGSSIPEVTDPTQSISLSVVPTERPTEEMSQPTVEITAPTTEPVTEPTTKPTTEPTVEETTAPVVETTSEASSFNIHFIDVGQADAALVECDGHYMLIDGGNKADSNVIYSVLKRTEVPKLDIVVGTHAHEDHIGGLPGAFNYTIADLTLCPVTSYDSDAFEDFAKYADQKGGRITVPSAGDTYELGTALVTILAVNGGSDTNDTSIILRIDYGQTSFLFTGDAEREAEQAVLNYGVNLSATVLKVGHHGSDTSTSYPFLREIMPKYAVISVGEGNSYGHPTEDALSRLRDADVKVFRTDLQGDIYCTSDGATVTFSVTRNADADVFSSVGQNSQQTTDEPQSTEASATEAPETEPPETESTETEPTGTDYILNNNTMKFHYPSCGSAAKIKEHNKGYYTGTRDDLISRGYSPCGNCHP